MLDGSLPAPGQEPQDEQVSALDAFGLKLSEWRRDAINGRRQLGIEDEWLEDEEFYIGVDDANRHEYRSTWRQLKPRDGVTMEPRGDASAKSYLFLNITRAYVDAAAARMADMLLPADDRCWDIEPTPIPELDDATAMQPVIDPTTGQQAIKPDGTPMVMQDQIKQIQQIAKDKAEKAADRIDDWMTESRFTAEVRKVIEKSARLGSGVLLGPVPKHVKRTMWTVLPDGSYSREVHYDFVPMSRELDPWDFFPDPQCGEDIQDGNYVWRRESITRRRLSELVDVDGMIGPQIRECLREGPIAAEAMWTPRSEIERVMQGKVDDLYEAWYFDGMIEIEDLISAGVEVPPDFEDDKAMATITMVNHRVIRASFAPLDDVGFPYDLMAWQKRPGMPWGIGVCRQMRAPQRMLLAASRNLMDNAGLSAGPQIVVNSHVIEPMDGRWELRPRKLWRAVANVDSTEPIDVEEAFKIFSIETRQAELMNIINLALRMAEETTGLPMILQGQMGEKGVDTLGGMKMLQNNASAVLRRLAIMFDESITIPHVNRYYEWLMQNGTDPSEKGDFVVRARGSSTLVEREIQNQELLGILQASLNPAYGLSPKKTVEEYLRSRRFDPSRFELTEEEIAEQQQQAALQAQQQQAMQAQDPAAQAKADQQQQQMDAKAQEAQAGRDHQTKMKLLDINAKNAAQNAANAAASQAPNG